MSGIDPPVFRKVLTPAQGVILPNGTIVVAVSMRNAGEWVLLALRPNHENQPYVTWKARRPGDLTDTWSGHYSNTIEEATQDFLTRP